MLLRVNSDGSSLLQLSCNNEFPYARRLKLAGMGLGKAYRLTPGEEGETLHDVVSGLKEKCPDLPEEYLSVEKWETVRFASRSELFVTGNYVLDRAWNQYMSWTDADSLS
ncbi:hypothetical protein FOZ60_008142 [Perkinsus olseni]|uniref:Uncharacterized protein n=1 Tax=Perkinsus olseni TaxID=32597 RepID=A0A7J6NK07_PEROL|nr:hypothetical protein FOZ60_008142 [Perkinsus olseni]